MDAWRRRFTRNVLALAVVLQLPFALLLGDLFRDHMPSPWASALAAVAVLVVNAPLFHRLTRWWADARASALRVWLADVPYHVHLVASLLFGPLAYLLLVGVGVGTLLGLLPPLRFRDYLGPLYAMAASVGLYASLVRRFWTVTHRVEVPVEGLPEALDGYTLVHLSDVHCGPYLPRWFYRRLAQRATDLGAHALVLTGDLIADGEAYLDDLADFAGRLGARDGVYASLGNHDYYGTTEGVPRALGDAGVTVLRNRGVTLASGLYLAGIDDTWSGRDDLAAALSDRPTGAACVLLAHDPREFPALAARGDLDLVLTGHTHGGQLAVPFLARRLNLAALRGTYTAGAYRSGRTHLYVHRGNGTSGPAVRLGAAPEIAVLTLRRAEF